MRRLAICALMLAFAVAFTGCSETTQQKAGDAMDQTGEALKSAAEDATNVTEGAIEGASEAADENQADPDTESPE